MTQRQETGRQFGRGLGKALLIGGKVSFATTKGAFKVTKSVTRNGSKITSAAARRTLGGTRYRRSADDVNGRIADALATLDALLRARDAEIARLQAEIAALRAQTP